MRILVAGGAGYIGSRLVPELLKDGHDIMVVDLLWFGNNLPAEVPVAKKNIFDIKEEELKGVDAVIFMAGLSNDPMAEYSPSLNFIFNASAPAYLAYIARRARVKRMVYASSCSVYGYTDEVVTEASLAKSDYPYGVSKLQGELSVDHFKDDNFSVIYLRQGTVSGYSPRMRFDLLLNTMYANAISTGKITVNNPQICRPVLAIEDAVSAYKAALAADTGVSGAFNVCSENLKLGEVAERARNYFKNAHGTDVAIDMKNIKDYRNYRASNKKAQEVLGVKFCGGAESILKELGESFGKDFDFQNDKYHNIKTFKKIFPENSVRFS